ncbi:hypothetical protein SAVIM338S_06170 [Streptomyces avidinii]
MLPDQPRIGARHALPCAAVLLLSLLCGACGGAERQASSVPAATPVAARGAPATLERIESALGCHAEVTVDAEELKEGGCEAAGVTYRMATFAAAEGSRAWLAESLPYGGTYLVGDLWVVTAPSPEALTALSDRLGGTLRSGSDHAAGHTAGDTPGESGGQTPSPGGGQATGHGGGH